MLQCVLNTKDVTEKLAPWCLQISETEFKVVHPVSITYQANDSLLRLLTTEIDEVALEYRVSVKMIT